MDDNPEIRLRLSSFSDWPFIRDLSKKAFYPFGEYGDVVHKWHISGKSITVIACYDENPLGFAMLSKPFSRYDLNNSSELLAIAIDTVLITVFGYHYILVRGIGGLHEINLRADTLPAFQSSMIFYPVPKMEITQS